MTYVFDTSAFISWWHEIYPQQSFPDIHTLIQQDVNAKIIQSPIEVKKELAEQDDNLATWAKDQKGLFIRDDPALQGKIAIISNDCLNLIKQHKKFNADPIIIALAESNNWIVVTQENPNKQNNIVGCCRDKHISCISLTQYIQNNQEQLKFIRQNLPW